MYSYIKDLYKHLWENSPRQKGKRIFISREFAGERRLAMSQTFVRQLLTLGFSIYCLETMSFQDQVQLFHSADIVCGPHGAGLTWITFCEPGTLVCELCPFMKGKGHYKHICDSMGFHYAHLFMCSLEGEKEEFKVDELEFFRILGHLVEQYTSSA